ncbi:sigma factor-like helix-turn-helix DNA-binding protein [Hydrogenibacillus sp. N12]|uniref:sigma factor-like helix-turn-helix DNA-binding protein n=1 Tax=Hydrogenibacillus sp. N12 TaxID=2866627 RepID=UPI001C7D9B4F|nr:sigma factor-like helix-turn-helix DNA-binding protein [Hydrogenibacillus sp. N12]QZA33472.1 helix-turn-helix domain-containing protein [Hydrogenibacillus sp. N12]
MLEKRARVASLYDLYGGLLSERQRRALVLYHFEDWSLSEVADALGMSRQAVHALLRRAEATLDRLEAVLGLWDRSREREALLTELDARLRALRDCPAAGDLAKVAAALRALEEAPEPSARAPSAQSRLLSPERSGPGHRAGRRNGAPIRRSDPSAPSRGVRKAPKASGASSGSGGAAGPEDGRSAGKEGDDGV